MTALLTVALLAAGPHQALLVRAAGGDVKPATADRVMAALQKGLAAAGLESSPSSCDSRPCALDAAAAKQNVVIVVTAAMALKTVVLDLEAVSVKNRTTLGQMTLRVKEAQLAQPLGADFQAFAKSVIEQLDRERAEPPPPPPPVVLLPAPLPTTTQPVTLPPPAPPPSRAGPVALVVSGGVLGAAGAVLTGLGASRAARLTPGMVVPAMDAVQLRNEGNGFFSAALGLGLAAGALVVSGLVWLLTG